jgi:O-antigen/teichoic acid export membrane protein
MALLKITRSFKLVSSLLSDESLTKKAYLNALASALDYAARLLVGFILQPLLVSGLGDYPYGLWQILNRLVGYISPASGRPAQALKWTLANQQASTDYELKRRHVGSTVVIWALFLPLMIVLGGVLAWFAPYWLNTPAEYFWQVRLVAGILVANLAMESLGTLPQSVLSGENLGYKRMGLSVFLVFVGGGLTWLALYLNMGVAGIAAAALATTLLTGAVFLLILRTYAPWFGVARPSFQAVRQFLGLSWWFLAWNLVMQLMMGTDVVVLGMLNSVESVTSYSLTRYVPETLISIVAIMVFAIIPGLGGIIGSGNLKKAASIRGEIMALTWLIVTALGASVLLWNRAFVGLWVGAEHYSGSIPALLIQIAVTQLVLIRNDASIIDVTLRLRRKVLMGALSVTLAVVASAVLVGYFKLGIVGLCLGIIAGRSILSLGYPMIIGRFLGVALSSQLKSVLRPLLVTMVLFALAFELDNLVPINTWSGLKGWISLVPSVGVTSSLVLLVTFYAGLSGGQRRNILRRVRMVITTASN